jgi:hypothetical protein
MEDALVQDGAVKPLALKITRHNAAKGAPLNYDRYCHIWAAALERHDIAGCECGHLPTRVLVGHCADTFRINAIRLR